MATRTRTPATKPRPRRRYRDILFEVKDQVAWVTINRPRVHNAFREQTLDEMAEAFRSTREDPTIACAVVTGAGTKAFSAGGDFYAMMRLNRANAHMWNDRMLGLAMTIRGLPIPVIAMVNGWCMGGGHELALWWGEPQQAQRHARPRVGARQRNLEEARPVERRVGGEPAPCPRTGGVTRSRAPRHG